MYQWVEPDQRRKFNRDLRDASERIAHALTEPDPGRQRLASILTRDYDKVMRTGDWETADAVLEPAWQEGWMKPNGGIYPTSGPWATTSNARANYLYQRALKMEWSSACSRYSIDARAAMEALVAADTYMDLPPRVDLANILDDLFPSRIEGDRARALYQTVAESPMAGPNQSIAEENRVKSLKEDDRYAAVLAATAGRPRRRSGLFSMPGSDNRLTTYAIYSLRALGRRREAAEKLRELLTDSFLPSEVGVSEAWDQIYGRYLTAGLRDECRGIGIDVEQAGRDLKEAAEREGEEVPWLFSNLGYYLAGLENNADAGWSFLRYHALTGQGVGLRNGLLYLHRGGETEAGIARLKTIVAQQGLTASAAKAARLSGQVDLEWEWRRALVDADPETAHTHGELALAAVLSPQPRCRQLVALEHAEKAVELAATDTTADRDRELHTLGRLHLALGNRAEAEEAFSEGMHYIPARLELAAMQQRPEHRLSLVLSTFDLHPDPIRKALEPERSRKQLAELAAALPGGQGAALLERLGVEGA